MSAVLSGPSARARLARRVAHAFATRAVLPVEAAASYPVPAPGPHGPLFSFALYLTVAEPDLRDYVLYEPELAVGVDASTLAVVGYQQIRGPVSPAQEQPLCPWLPPAVKALPEGVRDRLEEELLQLYEPVTLLFLGPPELAAANRAPIQRFDWLFRFLVAEALFAYYEWLGAAFFDWLRQHAAFPQGQIDQAPEPALGIEPPVWVAPLPWAG